MFLLDRHNRLNWFGRFVKVKHVKYIRYLTNSWSWLYSLGSRVILEDWFRLRILIASEIEIEVTFSSGSSLVCIREKVIVVFILGFLSSTRWWSLLGIFFANCKTLSLTSKGSRWLASLLLVIQVESDFLACLFELLSIFLSLVLFLQLFIHLYLQSQFLRVHCCSNLGRNMRWDFFWLILSMLWPGTLIFIWWWIFSTALFLMIESRLSHAVGTLWLRVCSPISSSAFHNWP